MFTKGQWAVVGISEGSQKAFEDILKNQETLYHLSQAYAEATIRHADKPTGLVIGINPFAEPRRDENGSPLGKGFESMHASSTNIYGSTPAEFSLNADMPWYGFWVVFNEPDDVDDEKSKLEHLSYVNCSRPFKFLAKDQKEGVKAALLTHPVGTRKQFPVLLDFSGQSTWAHGRVYMETTNKEEITLVRMLLNDLGVNTLDMTWDFGDADWAEHFLNKINEKNKFVKEMQSRAEDIRRGIDIEPFEDKNVEKIVKNFFALSELDSGQWAGLFPNTAIKLYDGGEPVTVSNPSDAFNLLTLGGTWNATVRTAGVAFQELDSRFTKGGEEKQVRTDIFAFDLSNTWINVDAGAALIRGFEVPTFKRTILKSIRKSKHEQPVSFYWSEWVRHLNAGIHILEDNVRLTLDLKKGGLIVATHEVTEEEIEA